MTILKKKMLERPGLAEMVRPKTLVIPWQQRLWPECPAHYFDT